MKLNESGFRPPLCTYRLNWARRTSWGWWDDWDDTVLQTRYLSVTKAPHNTDFHVDGEETLFVFFKPPRPGTEPRTLAWKEAVLTTSLGPPPIATEGNPKPGPSKHETLNQCWFNVGPESETMGQQWINIFSILCVLTLIRFLSVLYMLFQKTFNYIYIIECFLNNKTTTGHIWKIARLLIMSTLYKYVSISNK